MVRFIISGVLWTLLACGASIPAHTQDQPDRAQRKDQFFAGVVTAISDTQITVSRTILGKQSSVRTFQITPETRVEGKPKLKAKVTVEFVAAEEGDRAVHIIVRGTAQPKKS